MEDITKTGPVGLKGINRKLQLVSPAIQLLNLYVELANKKQSSALAMANLMPERENIGIFAANAGYGESMFDDAAVTTLLILNLQDVRAAELPWYAQMGAGIAKMGVLALTTFADGIGGTFAGLFNVVADAMLGKINSVTDGFWSFINNPFSQSMTAINDMMESALPNYYSKYEQEQPWYTQIGTANFIGDKFLKNLGFTIGAAMSAKSWATAGAKLFLKKSMRDAFKGAVTTAAGKLLKTGAEIYKAYKTGDALMDGAKLSADLGKAAKLMRNAEWKLKLIGATASAAGEGRIEAIHGADDWSENINMRLDDLHNAYATNLEKLLYEAHPEWFSYDAEGNPVLTDPQGLLIFNDQMKKELANYEQAKAEISAKKAAIGNSIFGLNVALLSASNYAQFGRAMLGGFKAGRAAKGLVEGSIKEGYKASKAAVRSKIFKAWARPAIEANEEMSQASVQEGMGLWGSSNINNDFGSFYGGKIDPDAEAQTQSWLSSLVKGFTNSYGDVNRWEEGFIGGLTGLLGIPSFSIRENSKGKKRLSVSMDGEFFGGLRDARRIKKEGQELADALNARVQDKEFLNQYQGKIRHDSLQATMDAALETGDKFDYKNAEKDQMLSDTMLFAKAGKLDDLLDFVEEAGNITDEDIDGEGGIRELSISKKTGKSMYEGKTNEDIKELFKKLSEKMKETISTYAKISEDLKALYGNDISQDVLDEITWGMVRVDDWEKRLKSLSSEIRDTLLDKAQEIYDRYGIDINVTLNNLTDFGNNLSADKNLIDEINEVINDKNTTALEGRDKIEAAIKKRQELVKTNNLKLGQSINKIRRRVKNLSERVAKRAEKERKKAEKERSIKISELEEEKHSLEEDKRVIEEIDREESEVFAKEAAQLQQELKALLHQVTAKSKKKSLKGRKRVSYKERKTAEAVAEIKGWIEEVENSTHSEHSSVVESLNRIELRLAELEKDITEEPIPAKTNGVVTDRRYKRGYDPHSKTVLYTKKDGTVIEISEAEAEERDRIAEKNKSIFEKIIELKESLNDPNNQLMSPLDIEKLNELLIDLVKIISVRSKFLDTYQKLSDPATEIEDEILKKIESAITAYRDRKVTRGAEKVSSATSVEELKSILADIEDAELIPDILEKAKETDNEDLKKAITEYESIEEMRDVILGKDEDDKGILGSIKLDSREKAATYVEAAKTFEEAIESSSSLKEVEDKIKLAIEDTKEEDEELSKALTDLFDRYLEAAGSKSRRQKDRRAKRKIKENTNNHKDDEEKTEEDESDEDSKDSSIKHKKSALESLDEDNIDTIFDDEDGTDDNNDDAPEEEGSSDEEDNNDDSSNSEDENSDNEAEDEVTHDNTDEESEVIKKLESLTDEELENIITNGPEGFFNITEEDKTKNIFMRGLITLLAKLMLSQRKHPNAHSNSKGTNSENKEEPTNNKRPALRNEMVTNYVVGPLKDRHERKAVLLDHPLAEKLRALKAYDFIDNGSLGLMLNENPDLTIHYILAPSTMGLENTVLLAVDMTDVDGIKPLHPIKGTDGRTYQIVGVLGYTRDKVAMDNREAILKGIKEEIGDQTEGFIVSKKYTNKISHIYSGRMVKSTDEIELGYSDLLDIIPEGEEVHLGIYYSDTDFRTPTITDEDAVVVKPNKNNLNPREGSVWLVTKEADGRYYVKAVQVVRFTDEEYDFEKNKNTPIMKEIRMHLTSLVTATTPYSAALAKRSLENVLYFPGKAQLWVDNGVVTLKDLDGKVVAKDIGKDKDDPSEKVDDVIEALKTLNLRFLISGSLLDTRGRAYLDEIIESNILITDLAMLHNVNASFDMPLLDPETGNPLYNVKPEETKGHTGKRGVLSSLASDTVIILGKRYSIFEDGTVKYNDDEVTNPDVIDEVTLRDKINKGIILPVPGNSSLYLGIYSSDNAEFGIYNGILKIGKELQELKKKAAERAKKEELKKNIENTNRKYVPLTAADEDWDSFTADARESDFAGSRQATDDDNNDDEAPTKKKNNTKIVEGGIKVEVMTAEEYENMDNFFNDAIPESDFAGSQEEENAANTIDTNDDVDTNSNDAADALSVDENFSESATSSVISEEVDELLINNIELLLDSGYTTSDLVKEAGKLGIDMNTLKTKEDIKGLLTLIKCGK